MNREQWLTAAVGLMTPWFEALDREVPATRVSVGWPGGKGKKASTIGQCWPPAAAEDGVAQIFVSPKLTDPITVLSTLLHELAHAVDGCQNGHRAAFGRIVRPLGLEGKLTATTPGEELTAKLAAMAEQLGAYPHAGLAPLAAGGTQKTRMLKLECPTCGYVVRTTEKWIAVGLPTCPCGEEMERA